jgi:alpha-N-arabinofuranosidase
MKIALRRAGRPGARVPATILGQNIELGDDTVAGLLSDRLDNPKFTGPPESTGMAPGWRSSGDHYPAFMPEVVSGVALSGNESQRLHCYNSIGANRALVQNRRSVRAGETLEVELWAKVEHHPATLRIRITPVESRRPEYAQSDVVIDAPYWKRYALRFTMSQDDDRAVFWCLLQGPGTVWIDQIHLRPVGQPLLCQDMLKAMASLKIPVLRMPGGCLAANYHWRHGTGPVHLRPTIYNPGNHRRVNYDFGTDEYLAICHEQGICPQIVVNISSGTPDEAADWAAHVAQFYRDRGAAPPPACFQMGNEHYGLWEHGHMSADMYAGVLRAFIPAIRGVYPNARIIALGEQWSQGLDKPEGSPWRETVLGLVKELGINVVVLNRYKGQWCDDDLSRQINAVESVTKIREDLEELICDCRARGLTNTVGITEWNYWLNASHFDGAGFHEPYDAQHCLFAAGVLNMFARLAPDFELGNFYHLVNAMGIFIHHGANVIETPMADLFRLYRPAFPGQLLPLEIDSPRLGDQEPAVDALCLKQEEATWLFLANRHPEQSAVVRLDGWTDPVKEQIMLSAPSPTADLARTTPPPAEANQILLPPLSIVRLRY